jgi:hypothetical protein
MTESDSDRIQLLVDVSAIPKGKAYEVRTSIERAVAIVEVVEGVDAQVVDLGQERKTQLGDWLGGF